MKQGRAFTLIELLVVLFVLSLVAGVAVFSMGVFKSSHDLENTTQAFSSRLRLAQMEATFEQDQLGVAVDERGYRFFRKASDNSDWVLINNDSLFKAQKFPGKTKLTLNIDGEDQSLDQGTPQLILQQGEISPFSITFHDEENHVYEISLNDEGEIVWRPL